MFVLSWARVPLRFFGECCFGMMYVEWYGVCNFVVFSVVEICVDYDGVLQCMFYVCWDLCAVYGGGICIDVCNVVCVTESCLFRESGCYLLCCYVV